MLLKYEGPHETPEGEVRFDRAYQTCCDAMSLVIQSSVSGTPPQRSMTRVRWTDDDERRGMSAGGKCTHRGELARTLLDTRHRRVPRAS